MTWNLKNESALPKMFNLFRCIVNTWLLIYILHLRQSPVHDIFRHYLLDHFVYIFYTAFFLLHFWICNNILMAFNNILLYNTAKGIIRVILLQYFRRK